MKKYILTALTALITSAAAYAHGEIEIGPNGGRLIEFASAEGLHAEVVLKGDKFIVGLYDEKAKKAVSVNAQTLNVTVGDRSNPKKVEVEKTKEGFSFEKPAGDDFWIIMQVRASEGAKARTGRLHYEAKACPECNKAEWLCACAEEKSEKKK